MNLGKLEKVDLRSMWKNEANDFTNWLAEEKNLTLLSDEIGIDIKLVQTEANVGSFNVDILAEEENTDRQIIIENQLELTDHNHLGKILTYASGYDASIIIWLVKDARDEHKRAIDWLNEHTDDKVNFFIIKIELWKIEDSNSAPKFHVISKPNDWAKALKKSARKMELSKTKNLQLEYWNKFKAFAIEKGTKLRLRKVDAQNWYYISIGNSACNISLSVNTIQNLINCEIWIANSKETYKKLFENKESIEKDLGTPLEWLEKPSKKSSSIKLSHEADINNTDNWDEYFFWMLTNAEKFHEVFKKYL